MFDIGAAELLLVAIVALVVIGPKDLPAALRGVGRVIGQLRNLTGQFRFSLDSMIREAEMEEQEKQWAQKNADIMAQHPQDKNYPEPGPQPSGEDQSERTENDVPAARPADDGSEGDAPATTAAQAPAADADGSPAPETKEQIEPADAASDPDFDEQQQDLFGGSR